MDNDLIGYWRIVSLDMVEGKTIRLIGGLPDEIVEFTADGGYVLWGDPRRPQRSHCRTLVEDGASALDVWIEGLESLEIHCLYQVNDAVAQVCIAGDSRPRPSDLQRDDRRLWCLMSLERSEPPPKRRPAKPRQLLRPGSLIPDELIDPP